MKIKPEITLLGLLAAAFLFQGCATVFGGRTNTLVFSETSTPPAQIYIDDQLVGEAPGKITVTKKTIQHGSKLKITADGYESEEYIILRKVHVWYTLANFAVGALPLAIDYATGDILRPQPRKFEFKLEKNSNAEPNTTE